MSKKFFIYIFIIVLSFLTYQSARAFTVSQITNNQVPEYYIYPSEFDKLMLDIVVPSGNANAADTLKSIVIQSDGNVKDLRDISKFVLWQDASKPGFEGMGLDTKIGEFSFWADNFSWYLDNLSVSIPANGLRLFVSVETMPGAVVGTYFAIKISQLTDQDQDGNFDVGDLGIFLASKNNGPTDTSVVNTYKQTVRNFVVDSIAPKAVITDPLDNAVFTTSTYLIKGMARDQQGSKPEWVKIDIDGSFYNTSPTSDNYAIFEYNWENITEGKHILKLQTVDFLGNSSITELITVEYKTLQQTVIPSTSTDSQVSSQAGIGQTATTTSATTTITTTTSTTTPSTADAIQALINQLLAQLKDLQNQLAGLNQSASSIVFKVNLKYGDRGNDVKELQKSLIKEKILSAGLDTGYFGSLTKAAVIKF